MDPGRPSGSLPHPPERVAAAVTPAVARTGRRAAGGFLAALALLAAALAAAPAPAWAQTVSLGLSSTSISEGGGVATVTASLTSAASATVTVTVSVTPVASTRARAGDYTLTGTTLTIAASATASTGTVTITAVNNDIDAPDKRVRVKGSAAGGGGSLTGPADVTLTIRDNEPSVTATTWRNGAPTANDWDITTSPLLAKTTAQPLAVRTRGGRERLVDFWACATRDATQSTQGYTNTGPGAGCTQLTTDNTPNSITLTQAMIDNDGVVIVVLEESSGRHFYLYAEWVPIVALPKATLTLSSSSIPENGGVATVTATLDKPASGAATVTVAASPGAGTDFTLSGNTRLVFADGATASTGTVTITATDDNADAPNAQVTISGSVAGDIRPPDATTLTLIDDEGTPMLALALSPSSISETGGVATVTATLSGASSAPVTVTVQAAPGTGATARDFTLSLARTLTIAANTTASTGTVTITAVNNDMRTASKQVTVSGSAAGGGVANPASVTLTVTDNDGTLPTGSDRRWSSWRGFSVTTTSLLGKTAPQTIAITAPPREAASRREIWACAYRTVSQRGIVTAPTEGATCSQAGQASENDWSREIRLTQAMIDNDGVVVLVVDVLRGANRRTNYFYGEWLPITALPKAALALTSSAISETGGVATVTATLDEAASGAATVTVTVTPGAGAMASDVTLSGTTELVFASGATTSTGTVTITAVGNDTDSPDKRMLVSGQAAGDVRAPSAVTLTLTDDDATPTLTLDLSSASISENGGMTSVTAALSGASSEAVVVTVTAAPDFTLSAGGTLTIAAGATTHTGAVTLTATDNDIDAPDKQVTVSATAVGGNGVASPTGVALTLTDDETLPTVALSLSPSSISETGGVASVTATLSGKSSEAVTVTVGAEAGTGAVAADFGLSAEKTLTIAAGATASSGDVTITANGNDVDSPDKSVTVSGTVAGGNNVAAPSNVTLTLSDDETLPTLTLALSSASVSETGGKTTVTATLSGKSSEAVTVTVGAEAGTGAVAADFGLSAEKTLTIAAGATASSGDVTITANGNDVDSPDKSVTVSGTVAGGNNVVAPSSLTLTLTDDETLPTVALALSPSSISETGGVASVTATLSGKSSEAVTVTVGAAAGTGAVAADFGLSAAKTLTIAAGATASSGDVTVTANGNDVDSPDKSVTVSGTVTGGNNVAAPSNVTLTLTDDETLPTVALALSPTSISETGGVASVTATLSGKSSEAVTVTVGAEAGTGAVAADFGLSAEKTLTIAAGATASSGDVTITANGNDVDSPDKSVTVSGTVAGGNNVAAPSNVTLTLSDDETLPTLTLALSSASVSETGGKTTVTATLSGKSSEALTVTVGAAAGTGAVAADFTLSTAKTLTFAVGATTSAGTVTVTANGNLVDTNDKTVTISATVAGGNNVAVPSTLTLTLTDDDTAGVTFNPTTLTLTEEGSGKKFTVVLDTEPPPGTAWVGIYPDAGLRLDNNPFRTFPNGLNYSFTSSSWSTPQTVTVDALADADHQDNTLRLRYVVAGYGLGNVGQGVAHAQRPVAVTVTVEDDDRPVVTLALSEGSISEDGGVATVTATLDKVASQGTTVTVSASPGAGTDFTQTGTKLTIAAGSTASTGVVTITASDDDTDAPDKEVTVSATVDGGDGASDPDDVTLTLADDEAAPGVALSLSAASIAENGGETTVSAALSHPSSAATTVTVTAVSGMYTVASGAQIVIAAGDTTSTDRATVEAVNDTVHQGADGRSTTVAATVANDQGAGSVSGGALTLTDDETLPTVTLALSSSSISETGGETTVTATLSGKSSEAVTVTVDAAAGTGAVAADFGLSAAKTLTIAVGATASSGDVTVTANGNDVHSGNKSVTVSGTVVGGNNVVAPSSLTLTLTDDETLPTVTLALSSSSISETGGETTVTATLSGKSSEAVVVTVGVVAGTGAVAADFDLSAAKTLTIAAGSTASAGDVTVTANGNDVHSGNKSVTVSGTVAGGNGVAVPSNVTLTLTDDETLPTVTLALSSTSISETGGETTVTATLSGKSSEAVTVTVAASPGTGAVAADFDLSAAKTLTIAAGATDSAGTVTVTANGNDVDSPNKQVTVSATVAGGNDVAAPSNVTLTLTDDETLPTLTLALSSSSISETGGKTTVTATLSGKSSEAVTVTVAASPGTGAVAADFDLSTAKTLTIAAGSTDSAGVVTVTANANMVDSPDKSVTISATVAGGNNVAVPSDVTLTLTDDDTATLSLLLSDPVSGQSDTIKELATAPPAERMTTVTATLSIPASAAVTITVSATAGTNAVAGNYTLSTAKTLTIAAGGTTSTGTVTITAVDDRIDSIVDDTVAGKKVVVKGAPSGTLALAAPADVELLIWEDDRAALVTAPAFPRCRRAPCPVWLSVAEGASETFTVKLNSEPTTNIAVAVKSDESDEGLVSSGAGTAAASTRLTFTATNWETAQTVTLHGVVDNVVDGDDDYTLRLFPDTPDTPTDAYHVIGGASVRPQTVRTTDVDVAGLTVSESTLTVTEGGTEQTFTVKLTSKPAAAVTVTATSADGDEVRVARNAGDADARAFAASKELVFTANDWNDVQTLRVAAVDDDRDDPASLPVAITLDTASGGDSHYNGLDDETVDVTKNDDDATPTVTLALSPMAISESGGVATVTATLSGGKSGEAVTVTVAASPGTGAMAADFALSTAKTLTIAAGSTASVGTVTVTANPNDVDSPDKQVTISGTVAGGHGLLSSPSNVTLTLTDDDDLPTVTLALSSSSISETGGKTTVTATLSGKSSEAVTVTVTASPGTGAVAADFTLTGTKLTIAAGATVSAGTVTVTANGNTVDSPDKSVTVSGMVAGGNGVAAPSSLPLTLTDDETLPTVTLALSPTSITETGGVSSVTATLSGKSSQAVTVTVGAVPGTGAVAADFGLSGTKTDHRGGEHRQRRRRDGDGQRQRRGLAGQVGDGLRHGGGRQRRGRHRTRAADAHRRRDAADGDAGAVAGVDLGDGRGVVGDGDAVGQIEPGGDGDGRRSARDRRGGGGLRPFHGEDPDHRGGEHHQRRRR